MVGGNLMNLQLSESSPNEPKLLGIAEVKAVIAETAVA